MAITVTVVATLTETDATTPNSHHISLTQDVPAGVSLILVNLSSVDASDGGMTSAPANIGGAAWVQDHVYHPGLDTSTVDVWRVNVVSPIDHTTTTVDVPGSTRGLSMECMIFMVDAPGYVQLDQSHDANNNFTTTHDSGLTATTSSVDLLLIGAHGMNQNTIAWTPEVVSPTWTATAQGNSTIGYASAIQYRIVTGGGGAYKSLGTTGANCTSNDTIVAYKAAATSQTTGIGAVALGAIAVPDTRTGHELHVRARKANPSESGSLRLWLYESGVLRSGPWDVVLTDTFTNSRVQLPDADVALIGSYSNLELRFQGIGPAGPVTPQVSFMELQTPGASAATTGASNFPAFDFPAVRMASAPMFRPGAIIRRPSFYDDYSVASAPTLKAITPTTGINATSSMSGAVQKLAAITPAGINATSNVSGSVSKLAAITPASISSTSTVSGAVSKLAAIKPTSISSTSTVSGAVIRLAPVSGAAISATSLVTATVSGGSGVFAPRSYDETPFFIVTHH